LGGRHVEQRLQDRVDERAARLVTGRPLGQPVDRAKPEQQRAGLEVGGARRRQRGERSPDLNRHAPEARPRVRRKPGGRPRPRSTDSMDDTQTDAKPSERRAGTPLGRLFGVPVPLSPSWLLLAALVTLAYGQILGSVEEPLPAPATYAIGFGF